MPYLWPYQPQPEFSEALEWSTEVIPCRSAEQRSRLRPYPRRELEYRFEMDDDVYAEARQLARLIGTDEAYVALEGEGTRVGAVSAHTVDLSVDATGKSYAAGGYLMVADDDGGSEVCLIDSIGTGIITLDPWVENAYSNAWVAPVMLATLSEPVGIERRSGGGVEFRLRAMSTETGIVSGTIAWSWRGYEVLTRQVAILGTGAEAVRRDFQTIDSGNGPIARHNLDTYARGALSVGWVAENRADGLDMRKWLYGRAGRWKPYFQPTWNPDIVIAEDIVDTDTTIEIEAIGFAALYPDDYDFVAFNLAGTPHFFRVASASSGDPGREVLTLSAATGWNLDAADIAVTSSMMLARLDTDRVEIQHLGAGQSQCVFPVVEVPG